MGEEHKSYRQILRTSAITGGASFGNILIGLVKTKIVALLLGPSGIGYIGLLANVMGSASTFAGMGLGMAGTRQIAEAAASDNPESVTEARRALFWGTLSLSVIGSFLMWLFRGHISTLVYGTDVYSRDIGWLAIGVGLTVGASSQGALLNGLRHIGDLARVSVISAFLSALVGLACIWRYGEGGLLLFVVAVPAASFIIGHLFVLRLPSIGSFPFSWPGIFAQWKQLGRLGFAFMLSGLVLTLGQLFVRTVIQNQLGAQALGYFQASWVISMTYMGLILGAMGSDFYPRLTGVIRNHAEANRLVNEQTEVALLLAGPIILAILTFSPLVVKLLYSSSFEPAVSILRWQILGDVLKVASWPLGFILLAAGDGRGFLFADSLAMAAFIVATYLLMPVLGLVSSGLAFFLMYALCLPLVYWMAWHKTKFVWQRAVFLNLVLLFLAATSALLLLSFSGFVGVVYACILSIGFAIYSLERLSHKANLASRLGPLGGVLRRISEKYA